MVRISLEIFIQNAFINTILSRDNEAVIHKIYPIIIITGQSMAFIIAIDLKLRYIRTGKSNIDDAVKLCAQPEVANIGSR